MMAAPDMRVERWTRRAQGFVVSLLLLALVLAFGPLLFSAGITDRLSELFVYVMLAVTWNLLAGYGGLVSVGQQAFFGLGAYLAVRLSAAGVSVYPALLLAGLMTGALALAIGAGQIRGGNRRRAPRRAERTEAAKFVIGRFRRKTSFFRPLNDRCFPG